MLDYTKILRELCSVMTVSGCEFNALSHIRKEYLPYFDSIEADPSGNIILMKKSKNPGAPRIMLDAHLDEVGMIVTGVTEHGFLRVAPIGGLDRNILPAAEVEVYGKKILYGVITPTPEHIADPKDKKAPEWSELLVDIGYSKADAEALAPIGTPIKYYYTGDTLLNGRITGRGFDDKSCAAALICAAESVPADELAYDVYITLSSGEETGRGGAACAAWSIEPSLVIVTDVNFALTPGVTPDEGGKLGAGPMISLSAVTDRALTDKIIALAKEMGIPITAVVEATSTGTNASCVFFAGEGIPTAVVSLPLAGMHSYNELLDLTDAEAFIKLISEIIRCDGLGKPGNK